jgi:hypothetical protein
MATPYPTPALATPLSRAARWAPTVLSAATTLAFAFLAFRLSFAALTDQAMQHGVDPESAWMFAVLVDGGALVGTVGVLAAQHAGRRTWPYWATTLAFATLSLTFNVAHSDGTPIGTAIAVTPPVALVVSIELLVRLLPPPPTSLAAETTDEESDDDSEEEDEASLPKAVAVYQRLERDMGRRPTAGEIGAALGVRRDRGGKIREAVETELGLTAGRSAGR